MPKTFFSFILASLLTLHVQAAASDSNLPVTLNLPEEVVIKAVSNSLPIKIEASSDTIGGSVYIKKIDNLQLEDDHISALLVLDGKNIQVNTDIAGHKLKLNIGDVLLDFAVSALLRFNPATQTLFIKPNVTNFEAAGNKKGNELGVLLLGLLNGKEFPVKLQDLQPIITDLGDRQLAIQLKVKDIQVMKDALLLQMTPEITASPAKI